MFSLGISLEALVQPELQAKQDPPESALPAPLALRAQPESQVGLEEPELLVSLAPRDLKAQPELWAPPGPQDQRASPEVRAEPELPEQLAHKEPRAQ